MTAPLPAPDPPDAAAARLAVLHGLVERGADIARLVHEQALRCAEASVQSGTPAPDSTVAFTRIARCVRRSIAHAQHVAQPRPERTAQRAVSRRTAARKQLIRAVEDALQHGAESDGQAGRLYAEFRERLDSPELDEDLLELPAAELAWQVVRDLGGELPAGTRFNPRQLPWSGKRRTPQDVAALCAWAAAAPGTPACELPCVAPPRATARPVPVHPDDLLDPDQLTDEQLDAACERYDARARARGSG